MKITKKILAIRSWPEDRKQKVLTEVKTIIDLPVNISRVKCSAFLAQLSAAALQFSEMGESEARAILWD